MTRKVWLTAIVLLLMWCADARAQCRVEGVVRWADDTPAVGLTVAIPALKLKTSTDDAGRYHFDDVRAGIRVGLEVSMGASVVARRYGLITLWVEQIDIQLGGTAANPSAPPSRPVSVVGAEARNVGPTGERAEAGATTDATTSREAVSFSADGTPTLSSEVTVTAALPMLSTSTDAGKVRLAPEQIAALPSLGSKDIFRALQLLPGVSSNETSSGLFVRGGTPDQNLVDYDGFTVYSVDHLFGYFSAFNMDAVQEVDLSKGGYEARYGGRLSSLTEIRGKSFARKMRGSVGASLLSVDGVAELPVGPMASLLVGGRRSFQSPLYDRILGLVNSGSSSGGQPGSGRIAALLNSQPNSSFDDLNVRFDLRPTGRDQISMSLYRGADGLDNSRDLQLPAAFIDRLASQGIVVDGGIKVTDVRDYGNLGISGRWNREWSPRVRTTATWSRSTYHSSTSRTSNVSGRQGATGETNPVDDWTLRVDTPIQFSPSQELTFGVQRTANRVQYQYQNSQAAALGSIANPSAILTSQLNRDTSGNLTSWYAQHRLLLGNRVIATPGIRLTQFSTTNQRSVEPRMTAAFMATNNLRFKGAWGLYHQYVNRLVREDVLQGNREFWALADGSAIPVSSSTNMAAGAAYETSRFLVDAEVFARNLSNISQLAPRVTGSTDGVDLSQYFYHGTGKVRGVEALVQRKFGRQTGWASYTLSRVTYDFPDLGGPFVADQDRTHELKLVDTLQLDRWTLSGTWIFSTGRPYTEPIGTQTITRQVPSGTRTSEQVIVGDKNGARLPTYHRLDIAANYSWPIGDGGRKGIVGLSVFNAYDRNNVWYKEFTSIQGQIVENDINLMKLTLNGFFTLKF